MSQHPAQLPCLFTALPACTTTSVVHSQAQSPTLDNMASRRPSLASSIGSIGTASSVHASHSFYNLSRESNKSNLDLTQQHQKKPSMLHLPHHPYASIFNHASSTSTVNSTYSLTSNASSSFSDATQYSVDKVHHAFGSLPPPPSSAPLNFAPSPFSTYSQSSSSSSAYSSSVYSSSSCSLPLSASINTPIATLAASRYNSSNNSNCVLTSPTSLPPKHRLPARYPPSKRPLSRSFSVSDAVPLAYPLSSANHQRVSSPTRQTLQLLTLTSQTTTDIPTLPNRRRSPNAVQPLVLNTKSLLHLPKSSLIPPLSARSSSTNMSSASPISASMFSPAGSNTRSDMSCHSSESVPSTPKYSGPAAAMAITDLLMSEAQYLSVIKRVASSLSEAAVVSQTAARKDSATLRALIDQWAEIVQVHTKFHNDTAAVNDDLRETARLINNMVATLEPMLGELSRGLPTSLKKLTRWDQNPEHKVAEWESALAQPFEHLASYDEWLQRVDPQARFSAECRARLNSVISKLKSTADGTAPQARNVFRRLSTMARGVIKRKSSGQGQGLITPTTPPSATESTSLPSLSPTTTPIGTEYDTTAPSTRYAPTMASHQQQKQQQQQIMTASVRAPMAKTVQDLTIADNNGMMPVSTLSSTTTRSVSGNVAVNGDMADTLLGAPSSMLMMSTSRSMLPLRVSTSSDVSSSMGTLTTLEASPVSSSSSSSSSTSSVHSKTSSSAETLMPGHSSVFTMNQPSSSSLARQTFLQEKENRKATLRIGTSELILAKAESLQSPTTIPKPAIEQLRKITQVKDDKTGIKPPVKSLINFWEQV